MSASGCIVLHKNLVLLARRIEGPNIPFSGYWSVFVGSIEPKETPKACAVRELFEETSITVQTSELKYSKTIYRSRNKTLDLFYVSLPEMPDVNLNFEHTEYGWFSIDNLKHFPYSIDKEITEAIYLAHSK